MTGFEDDYCACDECLPCSNALIHYDTGHSKGVEFERARFVDILSREIVEWRAVQSTSLTLGKQDHADTANVCIGTLLDLQREIRGDRVGEYPSQESSTT